METGKGTYVEISMYSTGNRRSPGRYQLGDFSRSEISLNRKKVKMVISKDRNVSKNENDMMIDHEMEEGSVFEIINTSRTNAPSSTMRNLNNHHQSHNFRGSNSHHLRFSDEYETIQASDPNDLSWPERTSSTGNHSGGKNFAVGSDSNEYDETYQPIKRGRARKEKNTRHQKPKDASRSFVNIYAKILLVLSKTQLVDSVNCSC